MVDSPAPAKAGELEALIGVEARWNTANLEALQPPGPAGTSPILEQWRWFREPPSSSGVTSPGAMS